MDEILQQLITERDEIRATFEPMRKRLARLDAAISALQGQMPEEGQKRRKNVRGAVIDIVSRSGDNGVKIA